MLNDRIWNVEANGATVVYAWTPQEDITSYELALCQPIFSTRVDSGSNGHSIGDLPDAAKRHFTKVG